MIHLSKLWAAVFILFVVSLFASFSFSFNSTKTSAVNLPSCGPEVFFINPDPGYIEGTQEIEIYAKPGLSVDYFKIRIDSNLFAVATAQEQLNTWKIDFNTKNLNNGQHTIDAIAYKANSTNGLCVSDPLPIDVQNSQTTTQTGTLELDIDPIKWTGPTNINTDFEAKVHWSGSGTGNVTEISDIKWSTTIGSITKYGPNVVFSSGPKTGSGTVTVTASYNGKIKTASAQVFVTSNTTGFIGSDDDPTDSSSDDSTKSRTGTREGGSGENIGEKIEQDPELQSCVVKQLGINRYNQIDEENSRPTFADFEKIKPCFSKNRFVIPASVAPIAPEQIPELKEASRAFMSIRGISEVEEDDEIKGLTLSGVALPNKTILIYVFSEPLVLTTSSDDQGQWSYTIEDPLAPGDHEAYIAVENEDGEFIRSSEFSFTIDEVAATENNPTGLSLNLSDSNTAQYVIFLVGAAAIIILAFISFIVMLRVKYHNAAKRDLEHHGISG